MDDGVKNYLRVFLELLRSRALKLVTLNGITERMNASVDKLLSTITKMTYSEKCFTSLLLVFNMKTTTYQFHHC